MKTKKFDIEAMLKNIDFSVYKLGVRRLQVLYVAVDEEDRDYVKLWNKDVPYFGTYKKFLKTVQNTIRDINLDIITITFDLIPDLVTCTEKEAIITVLVKRKN